MSFVEVFSIKVEGNVNVCVWQNNNNNNVYVCVFVIVSFSLPVSLCLSVPSVPVRFASHPKNKMRPGVCVCVNMSLRVLTMMSISACA